MATIRDWSCEDGCNDRAGSLFPALHLLASAKVQLCKKHRKPSRLKLEFPFGLNAKHNISTVKACFTSSTPETWPDKLGRPVRFFPFLVILDRHGRKEAAWFPYWHLIDVPGRSAPLMKYGQWAPFMDMHLFHDLLAQARKKGFLSELG